MRYGKVLVFGLLLMGLSAGWSLRAETGGNLLKNGGFETYKEGQAMPEGWVINTGYPVRVKVMVDKELAHGGKVFLMMQQTKGRPGAIYTAGPAVKKGEVYEYSLWAKGRGKIALFLYEYSPGKFLGSSSGGFQELTPQWKKYTFIYVVAKSVNAGSVSRVAAAIHLFGVAYVDDVVLKKIEKKTGE
jgi:hypothetical protein